MLGVKPSQLEAKDHKIIVKGYPQRNVHIGDVANHARLVTGEPPIGSASFNPHTVALDPETGQGKPFGTYVYATQIAEVEVDDETGEVEVLRIVASHDCGTAINPMLVEGQVEGGVSMGVGFALQEEILFNKDGVQINPNLTNYIMPTSLDMPEVEVDIVDNYDPTRAVRRQGRRRADAWFRPRRPSPTPSTTRWACASIRCLRRRRRSTPPSRPSAPDSPRPPPSPAAAGPHSAQTNGSSEPPRAPRGKQSVPGRVVLAIWTMRLHAIPVLFLALAQVHFAPVGNVLTLSAPLDVGFRQMYNLQFNEAHQTFQAYEQSHPQDAMGPTSRAAAYLFSEFERLGVLQTELFVNDDLFEGREKPEPNPAVRAAFTQEICEEQPARRRRPGAFAERSQCPAGQGAEPGPGGRLPGHGRKAQHGRGEHARKRPASWPRNFCARRRIPTTPIWPSASRIISWDSSPRRCAGSCACMERAPTRTKASASSS